MSIYDDFIESPNPFLIKRNEELSKQDKKSIPHSFRNHSNPVRHSFKKKHSSIKRK